MLRALGLALCLCLLLSSAALAQPVKLIALTFDDGPDNDITPQILDVLRDKGAKATFFIVGTYLIDKGPVLERELLEGHQLGSHTFGHVKLTGLTEVQIKDELDRLAARLRELTNQPTASYWLRPPYGSYHKAVQSLAGVPVIHWSIDAAEGKQVPGDVMAQYIIRHAFDGAIILMHDTTQYNADAIPLVVDALQAQGYEFVTVAELFRLKGVTPQNGMVYRKVTGPDPLAFDEKNLTAHWAFPYLDYLRAQGILSGDAGGIHPNRPLTRAMAASLLWRMEGSPPSSHNPGYQDVPPGSWSFPAVAWAHSTGLVDTPPGGMFGADAPMTREEFYALLARIARLDLRAVCDVPTPQFQDDRRIHAWARDDVSYVRQLGFVSVYDKELFRPLAEITRAEAAELITWYLTG